MEDAFEYPALAFVAEHACAQDRAIQPAIGLQHFRTEPGRDFGQRGLARLDDFPRHPVGIGDAHAARGEGPLQRAFPGRHTAGQSDHVFAHAPIIGRNRRVVERSLPR